MGRVLSDLSWGGGGGGCEAWSEALIVVVYSVKLIL